MSSDQFIDRIARLHPRVVRDETAYVRRTLLALWLIDVGVAATVVLICAAIVPAVWIFVQLARPESVLSLSMFGAFMMAEVRRRSFDHAARRASGVLIDHGRSPRIYSSVAAGFFGGTLIAFTLTSLNDPALTASLIVGVTALFLWYIRIATFVRGVARYFSTFPIGDGIRIDGPPARRLIAAVRSVAATYENVPEFDEVVLNNGSSVLDIGSANVATTATDSGTTVVPNALVIGLSLIQGVTYEQFLALLRSKLESHRLLSGRAQQFAQRRWNGWQQMAGFYTSTDHWGRHVVEMFNESVERFFVAHIFFLSRITLRTSDQRVVASGAFATLRHGLTNLAWKQQYLEMRFWPAVYRDTSATNVDRITPFSAQEQALDEAFDPEEAKLMLNESLVENHSGYDLLPTIMERLSALDGPAVPPEPVTESAAQHILGNDLRDVLSRADSTWRRSVAESFVVNAATGATVEDEIRDLEQSASEAAEDRVRAWNLWQCGGLSLASDPGGGAGRALEFFRRSCEADESFAPGYVSAGNVLLDSGDEEGIALLEKAIALPAEGIVHGYPVLHRYLTESGRTDEAERLATAYAIRFREESAELQRFREAAQEERGTLSQDDWLFPHGLTAYRLGRLRVSLAKHRYLGRVYLARKDVLRYPEQPHHIVGLEITAPWWWSFMAPGRPIDHARKIAESLDLPGSSSVCLLNNFDVFSARIRDAAGTEVYGGGCDERSAV